MDHTYTIKWNSGGVTVDVDPPLEISPRDKKRRHKRNKEDRLRFVSDPDQRGYAIKYVVASANDEELPAGTAVPIPKGGTRWYTVTRDAMTKNRFHCGSMDGGDFKRWAGGGGDTPTGY